MTDTATFSEAEAQKIREVVGAEAFPRGIRGNEFELQFGEDAAGKPALWIKLPVEPEFEANPSKEWISEITDFAIQLRSKLLRMELGRWPYISFKAAS